MNAPPPAGSLVANYTRAVRDVCQLGLDPESIPHRGHGGTCLSNPKRE